MGRDLEMGASLASFRLDIHDSIIALVSSSLVTVKPGKKLLGTFTLQNFLFLNVFWY